MFHFHVLFQLFRKQFKVLINLANRTKSSVLSMFVKTGQKSDSWVHSKRLEIQLQFYLPSTRCLFCLILLYQLQNNTVFLFQRNTSIIMFSVTIYGKQLFYIITSVGLTWHPWLLETLEHPACSQYTNLILEVEHQLNQHLDFSVMLNQ